MNKKFPNETMRLAWCLLYFVPTAKNARLYVNLNHKMKMAENNKDKEK